MPPRLTINSVSNQLELQAREFNAQLVALRSQIEALSETAASAERRAQIAEQQLNGGREESSDAVRISPISKEPKLGEIEAFKGERKHHRNFLASCELAFKLQPSRFSEDRTKVLFVGQHLADRALSWFRINYLENSEADFSDFGAFRNALYSNFGDPDIRATAQREIQRIFQGERSVLDYSIDFLQYSGDTGFNPTALIALFRQGLTDSVRDELIRGRDEVPDTLPEFIQLCVTIDNRQYERRQERREAARKSASGSTLAPGPRGNQRSQSQITHNSSSNSSRASTSNGQASADRVRGDFRSLLVNGKLSPEERARRMREGNCLRCDTKGHLAINCPLRTRSGTSAAAQAVPKPNSGGSSN